MVSRSLTNEERVAGGRSGDASSIGEIIHSATPIETHPLKIELGENGAPSIAVLNAVSKCRRSTPQSRGSSDANEGTCARISLCDFSFLPSVCGWYNEVGARLPHSERRSSTTAPERKFQPQSGSCRAGAPYSTKSSLRCATTAAAVWPGVAYDHRLLEKLSTTTTIHVLPGR